MTLGFDHRFDPELSEAHRLEVRDGDGGRRRWSTEAKERIVAESLATGAVVSVVARCHRLRPQQLFRWRKEARQVRLTTTPGEALAFVPVGTHHDARQVDHLAADHDLQPRPPRPRQRPSANPPATGEHLAKDGYHHIPEALTIVRDFFMETRSARLRPSKGKGAATALTLDRRKIAAVTSIVATTNPLKE